MTRWRTVLVLAWLLQPAGMLAQASRVELFGGASAWRPTLDATYDASYTPSRVRGINDLFRDPDSRSRARQLLTLRGDVGAGLGLGANVFLTPAVGLQILFCLSDTRTYRGAEPVLLRCSTHDRSTRRVLSDNVIAVPIDRMEGFLSLPDLELDPSHVRVLFGLKLKAVTTVS